MNTQWESNLLKNFVIFLELNKIVWNILYIYIYIYEYIYINFLSLKNATKQNFIPQSLISNTMLLFF